MLLLLPSTSMYVCYAVAGPVISRLLVGAAQIASANALISELGGAMPCHDTKWHGHGESRPRRYSMYYMLLGSTNCLQAICIRTRQDTKNKNKNHQTIILHASAAANKNFNSRVTRRQARPALLAPLPIACRCGDGS